MRPVNASRRASVTGRGRLAPLTERVVALALAVGVLGLALSPVGPIPAPAARAASTDLTVVTTTR